ncbi:60S ribosomal protein L15 [Apodemus speciosus]|uniref:60S ribosomal protein L15 n=1 Tax=Apodemus speciosus TaxID=105296 RepID=A0ABQ0FH88_APOSI
MQTALHYACAHGHLGVVTLLIERNCDIDACDDDNCTPLIKASQHQHEDCVAVLLQHGAEPNAVDALGNTALHYAVHSENTGIASQLLEHSANIEAKTKEGFTPLSLALRQNKDLIVELLIEKGANIHTVFHPDSDEVALKTSPPSRKASKAKKTSLPPDHLQTTSQAQKEKRKCGAGHRPAHSGCAPTKTAEGVQPREQLSKVLRNKLRTFPEPCGKEPPSRASKGKAHLKVEEERKYGLPELEVALENSDDRSACAVASASAAAAAAAASTSAKSASTSASAASNIASAALASASAASTSASVAFTSASAASTSAASASASAADASAAAAAASASASDASAAAAAAASAAAASAVASSNATVNTVVAAAVTAAFAAVTATADRKGNEPTPQRHSGATNDKDFALKEKEEHDKSEPATPLVEMNRSENKNCFPRDSIPSFGKCSADTSAVLQVKQSCARQLHQDEQRLREIGTALREDAKKQMNGVEGLEDGALPSEAASEDCDRKETKTSSKGTCTKPDVLSLIPKTQRYRDSVCLLGLCDELYLCKRLLEIKNSCGDILRREIKKTEAKHGGAHKELSRITKVSSLKQNEKIINDDCPDGIVKTELRGGERQYYEEFGRQLWSSLYHPCYNEELEVSQHEMFLWNLNMNLKALHNSVAQLQEVQLQEDPQREGVLSSARMEHLLWKLEVDCLKLEDSVKNQAEEMEEIENQLLREDLGFLRQDSPGCPGTHSVYQGGLELRNPPASASQTGDRKKERNEATQSTQSLACALDQEMEKSEELAKELRGFMELLKITGKKLDECENRELYFYEDMKNRTFEMLQHEGCTAGTTNRVVELVALSEATALSARRCQPTHLSVLVDWFGDPLGVRISSDSFMEWINEDNLKKFICGILTNPVGIRDSQNPTMAPSSLLISRLKASGKFQLVNTVVDRLAINYLKDTWEPIHCKYLHQDINIQLTEQELLKVKTEQENYEHLHKTQADVEKDVLTLKGLVQDSMIQAEEAKKLEKVRENNDSRMSQMILRVKDLESRLPEIKSQVDSTRREMEKHKQLCEEENKRRKSLSNTLNKKYYQAYLWKIEASTQMGTMEKLEVSKTKLMRLNRQKMTLETILSLLPAQQHLHVAKFKPAVGHNPRFPPRHSSCLPASEREEGPVQVHMGLENHMTVEAEEDSAPVDPWSFEASPL